MKHIALLGPVDKRVLVYPIARALSIEHRVSIMADDGAYRRLYKGTEDSGTIGTVDVFISTTFSEELLNKANETGINYDYNIIVSTHVIPDKANYIIYCRGINRSFCPEDVLEKIENIPGKEVVITYETVEDKSITYVPLQEDMMRYVFFVEETKQLHRLTNKNYSKIVAKIFAEALDYREEQLNELLLRKDSWEQKK